LNRIAVLFSMGGDDNNGNGNGHGTTPTPEPGAFAVLASGILGLFAASHRKFSRLREG
jgi:PEP-CTERM motif